MENYFTILGGDNFNQIRVRNFRPEEQKTRTLHLPRATAHWHHALMSIRFLDLISIRIKENVPVLKLFIKMITWNLKYNPFCRLIFLFIFEGFYCNYLCWLLWGSTTIFPLKPNIALEGQNHFHVIITNYEWLYYLLWTSGANKVA